MRLAVVLAAFGCATLAMLPAAAPVSARTEAYPRVPRPGAVTDVSTTDTAAPTSTAGAVSEGLTVTLRSVSPVVVSGSEPAIVTVAVRNRTDRALSGVVVGVRQAVASMTTRAHVDDWATSSDAADGSVLARTSVPGSLAAGASVTVSVTVADVGAGRPQSYGTLGVSIDAAAGTAYGRQHTFLGYQRVKQYVPLRLAVAVPLVLDANPALTGTGEARTRAWLKVTGADSRLGRILAATRDTTTTWLLDPELVHAAHTPAPTLGNAQAAPSATATSSPSPTPTAPEPVDAATSLTYAASAAEVSVRDALADSLRTESARHSTLLLPAGDPDVVAAASSDRLSGPVRSLVAGATTGLDGLAATTGVAWPADGSWSPSVEASTRSAYGSSLAGALVDSRWTTPSEATPSAERRSADGLPLAVYDDGLSQLVGATTTPAAATVATQRLVADTAALVAERAGTVRSVVAVAPRGLNPSSSGLGGLLRAVEDVPWLAPVPLTTVLGKATRDAGTPTIAQPDRLPAATPTPLTARAGDGIAADVTAVHAMASVRADGQTFALPWEQAATRLTATSWRNHRGGWAVVRAGLQGASSTAGIEVSPREINFLADSGRVQITVVNNLVVDVHDVSLTLVPDNPRLRVDTPSVVLRIGARSRTTVTFKVTAYAAGLVPITTTLSAPDGTVIRSDAPVRIRVSPTGHWIYWVIAAVAAALLVTGIWRERRRGDRTPALDPDEDVPT